MGEGPSRLTISVSMGDYQNTRFTLGGEDADDFAATVQQVFGDKADSVLEKYKKAILEAPYYDLSGGNSTPAPSAPPQQNSGWGNGSSGGNSGQAAGKDQLPEDPGRPDGAAPECEHGPKFWRNPADKPWQGWFCTANKRQGSCKTDWVN